MKKLTMAVLILFALVLTSGWPGTGWLSLSPSAAAGTEYTEHGGGIPSASFYPPASSEPLIKAYQHLAESMDKYHQTFDVYTDVGAAGNHFTMPGKIANDPGAVDIDPCSVEGPHSGATAIKNVFRNTTGHNWGGWYFLNGVLTGDERQPSPNWGDIPGAGVDLRGASQLTFWARGARGGEKIEFFMGGVGRDAATGAPVKPFPDSTPRIPGVGTTFTLTTTWTQYTVDLSSANLSYVLGGFAWVANAPNNPQGAVFWIDDVQYNKARLDEPRFVLSYVTIPSGQSFDIVQRNVAFTYDNAMAMLAFVARGTEDDWRRAKLIADAFVYAQQHDRFYNDGRLRNAYQAGDLVLPPGWTPNGKAGTVRMPGYWDCGSQQWFEDRFQVSTHTGNVAWAMIALLTYYEKKGGAQYLAAARTMGEWIEQRRQDSGPGGYRGGFEGWEKPSAEFPFDPVEVSWLSTEHNLDVFVAFTKMFQVTGDPTWRDQAAYARAFVEAMWNEAEGFYWTGTLEDGVTPNPQPIPLDAQTWSLLALGSNARTRRAMDYAETHHYATFGGYEGFDFNTDQDMPWFEGTGQMVVADWALGKTDQARIYLNELREIQATASNGNGKGIVAAPADGLTTGIDWLYFNRLHTGATAWFILAELRYNPYWQTTHAPWHRPTAREVDFDHGGLVDVQDIMQVASRWQGRPGDPGYDIHSDVDGDGDIDVVDVMLVAVHWGEQYTTWAENRSYSTTCAEEDNVNVPIFAFPGQVSHFRVVAAHPAYEVGNDNCAPDFSGCGAGTGIATAQTADTCQKLMDDGINVAEVCTEPGWWRPYSMTVVVDSQAASGHRLVLYRKIDGEASWPQFLVLYEDGNLRLKPHPLVGQPDVCFGSSVIIGPAAPATRPYVDIKEVRIDPTTLCLDITYRNGGTAHLCLSVDRSQAMAEVQVGYDTGNSLATFRSMWVSDGNADVNHLQTQEDDFPILSDWSCLRGPWWFFHRTVRSTHNTSAPDIRIEVLN